MRGREDGFTVGGCEEGFCSVIVVELRYIDASCRQGFKPPRLTDCRKTIGFGRGPSQGRRGRGNAYPTTVLGGKMQTSLRTTDSPHEAVLSADGFVV